MHVSTDAESVSAIWQSLESDGIHTYFQTRAWCLSWLGVVGPEIDAKALFVSGSRDDGTVVFLLPLQVRRKHGVLLLEFLSAPHASYGFGLFDKSFLGGHAARWFSEHFNALLDMLPRHDVVYLRDIPDQMLGYHNPLAGFARVKAANRAYMMAITKDFDTLLAEKRGVETLKSMRKRDKRLTGMGELSFGIPANATERNMVLQRMFSDHEQRLAETGVRGVYGPVERSFLSGLADLKLHGAKALTPYALCLDGNPICVLLGGRSCNVFWAMITSLADGPWRKHSPGDYTLRHVIAAQCSDDLQWFDFAVGDSDYKLAWADTKIDMRLVLQSRTAKGVVAGLGLVLKHGVKRVLKENAMLREGAFALRKFVRGSRTKP